MSFKQIRLMLLYTDCYKLQFSFQHGNLFEEHN